MTLLIAMTDWDTEGEWAEAFRAHLPATIPVVTNKESFDPAAIRYVAAWKHKPGSLSALPHVKAIFSLGAGVDAVFGDPQLPDVPVVRVVNEDLTQRMTEWVCLHVLMHHRQQRMYDWQQAEKIWDEDRDQPSAPQVRVGVMGLGVLGGECARRLAVLGFDVAGWSHTRKTIEGVESFAGEAEHDTFLARTEILVVLLPLTPETRGILARPLFEKLARTGHHGAPILLNAGRGGLQKEEDILACLEDGTLFAATLDVFEAEPLPQESPLWSHPRVTVTPHNSAISYPGAIARYIAGQIIAFEAGKPLANVVDRTRRY